MYIIYKTKCPHCYTPNCYNSGISIECVNVKCQFYSDKQHRLVQEEIVKLKEYQSEISNAPTVVRKIKEQEEDTLDDEQDEVLHYYNGMNGFFGI